MISGVCGQTIKSAQRLAVLMAGKARLLEHTLYQALISDENSDDNSDSMPSLRLLRAYLYMT